MRSATNRRHCPAPRSPATINIYTRTQVFTGAATNGTNRRMRDGWRSDATDRHPAITRSRLEAQSFYDVFDDIETDESVYSAKRRGVLDAESFD